MCSNHQKVSQWYRVLLDSTVSRNVRTYKYSWQSVVFPYMTINDNIFNIFCSGWVWLKDSLYPYNLMCSLQWCRNKG